MSEIKIDLRDKEVERELREYLRKRMTKLALDMESYIRNNLGIPGPSAPGSWPGIQTGALRASIGSNVKADGTGVSARIGVIKGPASQYAIRLELGFTGRDSAGRLYNQAPRPYLRRALSDFRGKIIPILRA